jgi:transposase
MLFESGSVLTSLPELKANVAGIDIGAEEIYAAIHVGKGQYEVRHFQTFTEDLYLLAHWLLEHQVKEVAMESTGVYWIPLFQILEAKEISVCLVNARHLKNVPGRKTDVKDSVWIQRLFSYGLLNASIRPEQQICAIRTVMRHRANLVEQATSHVQRMQKSLTQMNILLHTVIADLTGKSGLAILDAILAGERNRDVLCSLCDGRIRATPQTIAKALEGDYRSEHLFTLKQSLSLYRSSQEMIKECDRELESLMSRIEPPSSPSDPAPKRSKPARTDGKALTFEQADPRVEFYRLFGTDLTQVPGINLGTVATLFSELGFHLDAFPTMKRFCSWLGLCPGNKISGGEVLSSKTRKVVNRVSTALRRATQGLRKSQTHLGDFYRKMCARLGTAAGITATAHKLAQILYKLITTHAAYDETQFSQSTERNRVRAENQLRQKAARLGFQIVTLEAVAA